MSQKGTLPSYMQGQLDQKIHTILAQRKNVTIQDIVTIAHGKLGRRFGKEQILMTVLEIMRKNSET